MVRENGYMTFTAQLSAKQTRVILVHPNNSITVTGSVMQRAHRSPGKHFSNYQEALANYKCKKMKAVLEFMPEYIAQGLNGTVTI